MNEPTDDFGKRLEDKRIVELLSKAMNEVFSANVEQGKFIDVSRVPLICQSIISIHENIKSIKEDLEKKYVSNDTFAPIKAIVYGGVGIVLATVVGWVLLLIQKKP